MYFDRLDIVTAHYQFYADFHGGGGSKEYGRLCHILTALQFKPSPLLTYSTLTENGREIYNELVRKHMGDHVCPGCGGHLQDKDAPCSICEFVRGAN